MLRLSAARLAGAASRGPLRRHAALVGGGLGRCLGARGGCCCPGCLGVRRPLATAAGAASSEAATYVLHDDPPAASEEAVERGVAGDAKFAVVRLGGTQRGRRVPNPPRESPLPPTRRAPQVQGHK